MSCKQTTGSTSSDLRFPTASQEHDEDQKSEMAEIERYLSELIDMDAVPTGVTSGPTIASSSKGKSTRTPSRTKGQRRGATESRKEIQVRNFLLNFKYFLKCAWSLDWIEAVHVKKLFGCSNLSPPSLA